MSTHRIKHRKRLIERAIAHRKANRLGQGYYAARVEELGISDRGQLISQNSWTMCALGCLANPVQKDRFVTMMERSTPYRILERDFGIPRDLSWVVDKIFESSTPRAAKKWPERFARALAKRQTINDDEVVDLRNRLPYLSGSPSDPAAPKARKMVIAFLKKGEKS